MKTSYSESLTKPPVEPKLEALAPTPPMGWNSYDAYITYVHEKECLANLQTFVKVFKPLGYDYFVIDAGWYKELERDPQTLFPVLAKNADQTIDAFGRFVPSSTSFPNGFKVIAKACHEHGVKFGLHIMRGIPRKAVAMNTPVEGTNVFARDIADTNSVCVWSSLNYGIDMSKSGAQAYYDGWIAQLADYGVDFIKADDIVEFPDEIAAVLTAIQKTGRKIVLSLSPGDRVLGEALPTYGKADMLRVTNDIWDNQTDIDICFDSWLTWQYVPVRPGFWLDMDMIPFGELRVVVPVGVPYGAPKEGNHRFDGFTVPQKETFMTIRAMSASPLMMGGVLTTLDQESLRLLTNKEMIACNQNGVMGHLVTNHGQVQIWQTKQRGSNGRVGWLGIFNRTGEKKKQEASLKQLGLNQEKEYNLYDVWGEKPFELGVIELAPHGCWFIRYQERSS